VTICRVRTISRKGHVAASKLDVESSETIRQTSSGYAQEDDEMVRSAWRHAGLGGTPPPAGWSMGQLNNSLQSEIPCRVSGITSPYRLISVKPERRCAAVRG
jgi:hypothetical protein